jgi:hypothetical protein
MTRGAAKARQSPTTVLRESELSEVWAGQRFPSEALRLADGTLLSVIYRGRPGRGPGPDFRDAVLALADGTLLRGDVELHVRASDFRRHGHHRDQAYNRLVLHVVFVHDGRATLLESGREALVVPLAPWVASRAGELENWLSQPPLWSEPCRNAVERLGSAEVSLRLRRLGRRRFRQKADGMRRRIEAEGPDDAVYRELLEAAGYGPNRELFRQLAQATSWNEVRRQPREALRAAAAELRLSFERQTRPGAGPEERLNGAAILLARVSGGSSALASNLAATCLSCHAGEDLVTALTVSDDGRTLIGRGRAAEVAVNVALPAALCLGTPESHVLKLHESMADPGAYGLTAYLEGILRRQDAKLPMGAAERQGLLAMQKDYCSQGGCGACPLSPEVP